MSKGVSDASAGACLNLSAETGRNRAGACLNLSPETGKNLVRSIFLTELHLPQRLVLGSNCRGAATSFCDSALGSSPGPSESSPARPWTEASLPAMFSSSASEARPHLPPHARPSFVNSSLSVDSCLSVLITVYSSAASKLGSPPLSQPAQLMARAPLP